MTTLFADQWDAAAGLWRADGPGHTLPTRYSDTVHPGPTAASRLLGAAQLGRLDEIDSATVLAALRAMQWLGDDEQYGCCRWYAEEDRPIDTNAAFFTGLGLIVLRWRYADALPPAALATLDAILADLKAWFVHACDVFACYYPNKYLGDLCCGWLLVERYGDEAERILVATRFRDAARYWLDEEWGWGEHLSDGYSGVCLDELGLVLALGDDLPADLRDLAGELLRELIDIHDAADGGPRVPAIRSYAFTESPEPRDYRARIRPFTEADLDNVRNMPFLGGVLEDWGWHDRFPRTRQLARDLVVPCVNGNLATARQEADIRLGSLSAFPLMPAADHLTWGLSWQSFPVCCWRPAGDWGFLQWRTVEHGTAHAHPAVAHDERHNPVLSNAICPPLSGRTFALQRGGNLLALRLMPAVSTAWEELADRWRFVGFTGRLVERKECDGWWQTVIAWPERTASLDYVDFGDIGIGPEWSDNDLGGRDWSVRHAPADLADRRAVFGLWGVCLDGDISNPPVIRSHRPTGRLGFPEQRIWEIEWPWPGHTWHVVIDPLAAQPLAPA